MTLNDDPKLTAFALGELSDAEREALEAQLDDAARAEIAEIEKLGDLLSAGLAAEPLPALDPAQRDAIEAAASDASEPEPAVRALPPAGKVTRLPEWFGQVAVVAATLAILLGLAVTNFESALNDAFEGATNTLNSQVSEPVIATSVARPSARRSIKTTSATSRPARTPSPTGGGPPPTWRPWPSPRRCRRGPPPRVGPRRRPSSRVSRTTLGSSTRPDRRPPSLATRS